MGSSEWDWCRDREVGDSARLTECGSVRGIDLLLLGARLWNLQSL